MRFSSFFSVGTYSGWARLFLRQRLFQSGPRALTWRVLWRSRSLRALFKRIVIQIAYGITIPETISVHIDSYSFCVWFCFLTAGCEWGEMRSVVERERRKIKKQRFFFSSFSKCCFRCINSLCCLVCVCMSTKTRLRFLYFSFTFLFSDDLRFFSSSSVLFFSSRFIFFFSLLSGNTGREFC